ncbi:MAG: hypothetical protein HY364_03215 [Candidatus Aenigmarchaeota archaeon]|nr:hypothetical protein [Candidatus Aenigmarchaeota archaeon]
MEDRKYIIMALLYALLLFPAYYGYKSFGLPETSVLAVDNDATYLGTVKSALWGFATPWPSPDVSIFTDVTLGSAFAFLPVTAAWLVTGIDPWPIIIFLNTAFTFGYLVVILKIMQRLLPAGEWKYAFPILLFANGIGGLLYFPLREFGGFTEAGLGNLFWGWMTSSAFYQIFTLFTGFAALLLFMEGRNYATTALLFLTFLIYPIAGALFSCLIIAYSFFDNRFPASLKLVAPSLLATVPWGYFILLNSAPYEKLSAFYSTAISFPQSFMMTVAINSGIAILLAIYAVSQKGFFDDKNRKFLCAWAVTLLIGILLQTAIKKIDVAKLLVMYWVPVSILAGIGLPGLAARLRLKAEIIFIAIMILSLPSLILFYANNGVVVASEMDRDVYASLIFLRSQPQGIVLTDPRTGRYVPYLAEKRSLTGAPLPDNDAETAYENFLEGDMRILETRNITYIMTDSMLAGNGIEKIYSSGNRSVYVFKKVV